MILRCPLAAPFTTARPPFRGGAQNAFLLALGLVFQLIGAPARTAIILSP